MINLITVSPGNSKLGSIPNISLRPVLDCKNCSSCKDECYAVGPYTRWKQVRGAWDQNSLAFRETPDAAFFQLAEWIQRNEPKYFRIHVGGDFLDQSHVDGYCRLAKDYPNTKLMALTKRNDLEFKDTPKNLSIIQSVWPGCSFPGIKKTRCSYIEGDKRIPKRNSFICTGHCEECYECWNGKTNIVLHKI